MWRGSIILVLASSLFFIGGSQDTSAQGCKEFGQFIAGSAQAPGPFGQLIQERVPDFSEDVSGFMDTFCENSD